MEYTNSTGGLNKIIGCENPMCTADNDNLNTKCIFISYSQDSDEHRNIVLKLSERLRRDGLKTELDQYEPGTPSQGWPRWMLDKLDEASHVLVICTETYYRRFRGHEAPNKGKGVDWEGALITQELYDARSKTCKFVPVLFDCNQQPYIPEPLRSRTHYVLDSEQNYQALYDFLLDQAGVEPGDIGQIKVKPKQKAEPLTFESNSNDSISEKSFKQIRPNIPDNEFKQSVLALAKFIDRPKEAHHHVIKELEQNRVVKACLCLFTSRSEDKPMDFAKTLRERLRAGCSTKIVRELLLNLDDSDCKILVSNPWDYDKRDDFITDCRIQIGEQLGIKYHDPSYPSDEDVEKLQGEIFKVLKNAKKPIIMISEPIKPIKKGFLDFSGKKLIKKINERFAWIKQIDAQLENSQAERSLRQGFQPMVLLFCLQVKNSLLEKANRSFCLTKVTESDFIKWRASVINLFSESKLYDQLDQLRDRFKTALSYQQFLKHIESSFSPGNKS